MAVLNTASATARHTSATDPEIEAGLLNVVGMTFVALGKYSEAEPLIERALTLRNALFSGNHPAVAESLESKATLLRWRGEFDWAERLYRDALAIARRTDGANLQRTAQILRGLGLSFSQRGDDKAALTSFDEALQLVPPQSGHDRTRAELLSSAGVSHRRLSNYTLAEAFYREALSIQRRLLGPEHAEVGTILNNLGVLMNSSGRYDEAEPIIREFL